MQSREVGNPNGNNALLELAKRMAEGSQGVDGGIGALAEQVMKMQASTQEALKALAEENRQMREELALIRASEEKSRKIEKEYQSTMAARVNTLEQAVQTTNARLQAVEKATAPPDLSKVAAAALSDKSRKHPHRFNHLG